jgi:hypothetical protein
MGDLGTEEKMMLKWVRKEQGCVNVDLVHLAQDRHQWWVPVNRVSFKFHTKQTVS